MNEEFYRGWWKTDTEGRSLWAGRGLWPVWLMSPVSVQVSNPAPATNLCGFSVKRTSFGKRRLASEQAAPLSPVVGHS